MASNTKANQVTVGCLYIQSTFNNTIVSVTDRLGNVIRQKSAGTAGFKGSRKSTPFAAEVAVKEVLQDAMSKNGLKEVTVYVKGPGPGREAIRIPGAMGLIVLGLVDKTRNPHNGCRRRKKRRV